MSKIPFAVGFAMDSQTAFGSININTTIRDLSASNGSGGSNEILSVDGAILGDRESGDANSGLTIPTIEREGRAVADVSGSFTKQIDSLLRRVPNGFAVAFPFKGNGRTASGPPVDADFPPATGVDAILRAAGWTRAAGATQGTGSAGQTYTPAALTPATGKLWLGDSGSGDTVAIVLLDLVVASLSIEFTPGGIGLATANLQGRVHSDAGGQTFPAFDYAQLQGAPADGDADQTITTPVIESVGHTWSTTRGWAGAFTLEASQTIEDVSDSNASDGLVKRQTDRTITLSGPIYTDDADEGFEIDQNEETSTGSLAQSSFTVGSAASAGETISGYYASVPHPLVTSVKHNSVGGQLVATVSARAVDTTADTEAEIQFI